VIICGDFNDIPDSLCYKVVSKEYTSSHLVKDSSEQEPWTTWKKRQTVVKRAIDYIWYASETSKMEVLKLLEVPNDSVLPDMLPASYYPSDHLALAVELSY